MPKIRKGYTFLASIQIYQCNKRVFYYCKIHIVKKARSKINKIHGQHETHFSIWGLLTHKTWCINAVSMLFFNSQNFRIIEYFKLEEIHEDHSVHLLLLTILYKYNLKINHITKSIVQTLFELWQTWYCHCFPEEVVSVFDLLFLPSHLNFSWCRFTPFPHVLLLITRERTSAPPSFRKL